MVPDFPKSRTVCHLSSKSWWNNDSINTKTQHMGTLKQTRLILLAGSLFEEGILWLVLRTSYQTGLPSWLGQQFCAKFHSVAWLSRAAVEVWMRSSLITFFCCAGQCYARLLGEKLKVKLIWIISSI